MSRVAELRARREALLLRSATLRLHLIVHGDELESALTRVDRGIHLVRSVASRPMLLAAGAGLLFAIGPRKALRWVSRGLFVTSIARRAYAMFGAYRSTRDADEAPRFI